MIHILLKRSKNTCFQGQVRNYRCRLSANLLQPGVMTSFKPVHILRQVSSYVRHKKLIFQQTRIVGTNTGPLTQHLQRDTSNGVTSIFAARICHCFETESLSQQKNFIDGLESFHSPLGLLINWFFVCLFWASNPDIDTQWNRVNTNQLQMLIVKIRQGEGKSPSSYSLQTGWFYHFFIIIKEFN